MIIELLRHGETVLNGQRRYQGRIDAPLSEEGKKKLKRAPGNPVRVYVSPLRRARQTASILFPDAEQIVVKGFAEMDFGAFDGKNFQEMRSDPDYRAWVDGMCEGKCPGGESRQEFCDRTCAAFLKLLQELLKNENSEEAGNPEGPENPENPEEAVKPEEAGNPEGSENPENPEEAGNPKDPESLETSEDSGIPEEIVVVAHGGTQMALMQRFGAREERQQSGTQAEKQKKIMSERRSEDLQEKQKENRTGRDDYFSWQLPPGWGYVLEADIRHGEPFLTVLETRNYTVSEKESRDR